MRGPALALLSAAFAVACGHSADRATTGASLARGSSPATPGVVATIPASGTATDDAGAAPSLVTDPEIAGLLGQISPDRIATTIQTLAAFGTRSSCSSADGGSRGIGGARDWIEAQLTGVGGLQTMLHPFSMTQCGGTITRHNVVASLRGAGHPERLVVVGGHYDSRTVDVTDGTSAAPGANDSGSQTALVLELARALAPHAFDATLVFVAFAGEEQGLVGSAALAQNIGAVFPGASVVAMLDCDIVGGDDTANDASALRQFRLFAPGTPREIHTDAGTPDDTSPSRGLMRYVDAWGRAYVPALAALPQLREDRPGRGGDHESFIAGGAPGVRFIDPAENLAHEHTANDLFQYLTPSYTAQIAQVVAAVAASLARAPASPASFVAQGSAAGGTTLTWAPPPTGSVDHYVVAARPTTENFYRSRVAVGGATHAALAATDLAVADVPSFFLSVAAVDAAGHESLFAYPEYRCDGSGCAVQPGSLDITTTD